MARRLLPVLLTMALLGAHSGRAAGLLIIANPDAPVAGPLSQQEIASIFLLRTTLWPDGSRIVPVNREASSAIRAEFTQKVLGQDNASLTAYWNQMHFNGKLPPVVQESDAAMLAFVQHVAGAIGYVDAAAAPAGVKVIGHVD
jgi:ABC-type phosphate transport system substrate-binding protein